MAGGGQPSCRTLRRGIANPVGVKVGPTTRPDELVELIKRLNPRNTPGKVTLVTRFGAGKVQEHLPALIRAVERASVDGSPLSVGWVCDPMHGNTEATLGGLKTRSFDKCVALVRVRRIHSSRHDRVHRRGQDQG